MFESIIEQGFIFGILALGVYITYKILDFPDLSCDGTIVLGGSITALLITNGTHPIVVTLIALLTGASAGLVTGMLHVYLKITNLLAGILVMVGLYSINLRIMGKPNIQFFKYQTLFTYQEKLVVLLVIVIIVKVIFDVFLKTKLGVLLRMTGDNPRLVTQLGKNIGLMKILGLMLSNALIALSGSLLAQYQRFTDINSGTGTIIIGLTSVILGNTLYKIGKKIHLNMTMMVLLGAILYKSIQVYALRLGFDSADFKLISAIIIIIILGINNNSLVKKVFIRKELLYVKTN